MVPDFILVVPYVQVRWLVRPKTLTIQLQEMPERHDHGKNLVGKPESSFSLSSLSSGSDRVKRAIGIDYKPGCGA
jgi:hypothetical protein